jgi:hypothetical protein
LILALFGMVLMSSACRSEIAGPAVWDVEPSYSEMDDSVSWDQQGVLEFTDSLGTDWKLQRYGSWQAPTHVSIWRDEVYQGDVVLQWDGGSVPRYVFDGDGADWGKTDDDAVTISTFAGIPYEGPPESCEPEEQYCCDTEDPEDPDCWLEFTGPDWGSCSQEQSVFEGYAITAITGVGITSGIALVQIVTKAPLTNIVRRSAFTTAAMLYYTYGAFQQWAACLFE